MGHPGMSAKEAHEHHKHGMHHKFDDPERWAKIFDDPKRDEWQRPTEIVKLMEIEAGMTVADIGAGTGYMMPHLAKAAGEGGVVMPLDIEPNLVKHMRERAEKAGLKGVKPQVIQMDDPELDDGQADRVLVLDTWHHISDRVNYARKVLAGLKAGGKLVVVDFTPDSPHGPPAKHRVAAEQIVKELTEAGFEATVAQEELPYQYVIIGARP